MYRAISLTPSVFRVCGRQGLPAKFAEVRLFFYRDFLFAKKPLDFDPNPKSLITGWA
jgi:hypothetical protein